MDITGFRIDFDDIDWQHPLPGCRFKVAVRNKRQLRVLEFTREFVEPDWCAKAHSGIVLEGTLEIDFRGKTQIYPQGSGVSIPAGAEGAHKARAISERVVLFLVEDLPPEA